MTAAAAPPDGAPADGVPRIGLFGGAFDPPHRAHVALARAALAHLALQRLHIVPTGQPPHRSGLSDARHRLAMAQLAFGGLPGVVIDEREIRREGPSYTIDTLEALARENPGAALVLVIGEDQARALTSWRRADELTRIATIVVAQRPDSTRGNDPFDDADWQKPGMRVLPVAPDAVSASAIRAACARGERVDHLVDPAVARYIDQHHLYRHA